MPNAAPNSTHQAPPPDAKRDNGGNRSADRKIGASDSRSLMIPFSHGAHSGAISKPRVLGERRAKCSPRIAQSRRRGRLSVHESSADSAAANDFCRMVRLSTKLCTTIDFPRKHLRQSAKNKTIILRTFE